jgi:hypothetical protein
MVFIHSGRSPNHLDMLRHSRAVTGSQYSQAAPLASSFVFCLAKRLELMMPGRFVNRYCPISIYFSRW